MSRGDGNTSERMTKFLYEETASASEKSALRAVIDAAEATHTHTGVYEPLGAASAAQAFSIQRGNHNGTQAISTINGLQTELDGKATSSHTHTLSNVTDAGTAAASAIGDFEASGAVTSGLASFTGNALIVTVGTIATGTWEGTAIADGFISSAATWNGKAAGTVISDYIGASDITSSSGVATPDANNGRSQNFPLTETVTDFNTPLNLNDRESMLVTVIQDSTPRTFSLDASYKIMGSGTPADIGTLAAGKHAWLAISRVDSNYLIGITTES